MRFDLIRQYSIPYLHPLMVHFPLVLLLLAAGVAVLYAALGQPVWRIAAFALFALGAVGAFAARQTGHDMAHDMEGEPVVEAVLPTHKRMADYTLWTAIAAALGYAGLSVAARRRPRAAEPLAWRLAALVPAAGAAALGRVDGPPRRHHGLGRPHRAMSDLSDRDRDVLRRVVQTFIDTAAPVGSRAVADHVDLSSASVRTTMQRLEGAGYLGHPHTSAGRVPTEQGYRLYVDGLMDVAGLSGTEARLLRESVARRLGDLDAVAQETSRLLGSLARLLGVVLTPRLATGVLERIEVVPLGATRVLFVLALRGGLARTVAAEVDVDVRPGTLDAVVQRLNERLAGHSLDEIRRTGAERVQDLATGDRTGIVPPRPPRRADALPRSPRRSAARPSPGRATSSHSPSSCAPRRSAGRSNSPRARRSWCTCSRRRQRSCRMRPTARACSSAARPTAPPPRGRHPRRPLPSRS